MSIQRQYTQPSCTLLLEGIEEVSETENDILDGQLPMSILVNAECNFLGSNQKLSGGMVFLNNLARAVSDYAQGVLSGLPHPQMETTEYPQIQIEKVADRHLHRFTLQPAPDSGEPEQTLELTTVELFDLVDVIDQFYADRHTLPNLALELRSLSKRYRQPEQPLAERVTPLLVGAGSLAIAAGVLFMIPIPKVPEPKPELETNPTPTETVPTQPDTSPPGTNPEVETSKPESDDRK